MNAACNLVSKDPTSICLDLNKSSGFAKNRIKLCKL